MIDLKITGEDDMLRRLQPERYALDERAMQRIGEAQRLRILRRVEEQGLDTDGRAFAPYSKRGPYYYNPRRASGTASPRGKRGGGDKVSKRERLLARQAAKRFVKRVGSGQVTPGGSVRFASYAAFKAALGRSGVDLAGPNRRMLGQVVTSKATGEQVSIGIYGEAAARASAHQEGAGRLPRRRWLGATRNDVELIRADVKRELARSSLSN